MKNDFIKKCVHDLPTCCQLLPNQMYSESQASELAYDEKLSSLRMYCVQVRVRRQGEVCVRLQIEILRLSRQGTAQQIVTIPLRTASSETDIIILILLTIRLSVLQWITLSCFGVSTRHAVSHSGRGLLSCRKHKTCCLHCNHLASIPFVS